MLANLSSNAGGNKKPSLLIPLLIVLLLIWAASCTSRAMPKGVAYAYNDTFALYSFPLDRAQGQNVYFYPIWYKPAPKWLLKKEVDTLVVVIESGKAPVYTRLHRFLANYWDNRLTNYVTRLDSLNRSDTTYNAN